MENLPAIPTGESFSLEPKSLQEAMQYADIIAKSDLVPKDFRGKPGNVLVAVQMGAELGLKPLQAIQNIAVVNGRPSVWGDALLAVCMPHIAEIKETFDPATETATCFIRRKNGAETTGTFSFEDAKKANLFNKEGPWKNYPRRMAQMRARGFALRDSMPDVLRGIVTAEEAGDMVVIDRGQELKQEPEKPPRVDFDKLLEDLKKKKFNDVDEARQWWRSVVNPLKRNGHITDGQFEKLDDEIIKKVEALEAGAEDPGPENDGEVDSAALDKEMRAINKIGSSVLVDKWRFDNNHRLETSYNVATYNAIKEYVDVVYKNLVDIEAETEQAPEDN